MADTKISALTGYTTPLGADILPIVDVVNSQTKGLTYSNLMAAYRNTSTASQGPGFAADTYLTGSNISVPVPNAKSIYRCVFDVSKTAAGTATPIVTVRFGTNGSTADAAILTLVWTAGTAAADVGTFEILGTFRTVGSGTSAVVQGTGQIRHNLTTTGLVNLSSATLQGTGAGFNSTVANSIMGISVNGGLSAVWTVQNVQTQFIL